MIVYIAGAVDLIDPDTAEAWRLQVHDLFDARGVDWVDPCHPPKLGHSPKDIVFSNRQALLAADAMLAEHAYNVPHYGTTVAIEEAIRQRKPTVVWVGDLPVPLYLRRHKGDRFLIVDELPKAVEALLEMTATITKGVGRDEVSRR